MTEIRLAVRCASDWTSAILKQALGRGVREASVAPQAARKSVCVWEDDKVVWIAPEDIEVDPDRL